MLDDQNTSTCLKLRPAVSCPTNHLQLHPKSPSARLFWASAADGTGQYPMTPRGEQKTTSLGCISGSRQFHQERNPPKKNPRVNPSYPPTPADSRGSASQRNYTQQVSSADARAKMFSKFKKRERRKQSSCTSKEQASKKQKKK